MPSILDLYNHHNIARIDDAQIEMEWNGFMLDEEYCRKGSEVARADERALLDGLAAALETKLGRTPISPDDIWSSPAKIITVLEKVCRLPPSPYKVKGKVDLAAGKRSVDKRALEWISTRVGDDEPSRRIIEGLTELRRVRNSVKYLEKLPRFISSDGFIHPVCGPAGDEDDRVGAITGRFGMKLPEGQQIPKDPKKDRYFIRRAFVAPPGMKLIVADYTALEVVVLANICEMLFGDTLLLDLTEPERIVNGVTIPARDIHAYNAHRIFGEFLDWRTDSGRRIKDYSDPLLYKSDPELAWYRDLVKAIWYGLMYGKGAYGFGLTLKDKNGEILGEKRAGEILDALYQACPAILKWHGWVESRMREHPTICGLDGREINYADLVSRGDRGFKAACRGADNAPMQITGAACIGAAMVSVLDCPEIRRLGGLLQLQIHDELQLRGPEENSSALGHLLKEHMENAFPLKNLKSTVGIGDNWLEAK
jgi:DNA polymerase I-like protein with 3'-5' exonuclease and polymerase domains